MDSKRTVRIRIGVGVLAALGLDACGGDECGVYEARCGSERGTLVTCHDGSSHVPFGGGHNTWVESDCPGIDPVCESADGQVECKEAVKTAACGDGATVLADAPGDFVRPRVADLDGDGRPDLLLTCSNLDAPKGVWRSLQTAGGGFSEASKLASAAGTEYIDALIGDVDGDGRADVVAMESTDLETTSSLSALVVLLARGDELVPAEPWPMQAGEWLHALADLDGDGAAELLLTTATGAAILALDGDALTERDRWDADPGIVDEMITTLTVADIAGDGRPLVLLETLTQFHAFAASDGGYVPGPPLAAPSGAIFADFDGDGASDFVAFDPYRVRPFATVAISDRAGGFDRHTIGRIAAGGVITAAEVDGKPGLDLISFHDAELMSVITGASRPGKHEARTFALPQRSATPVLADLDGDGRTDIVAGRAPDPMPWFTEPPSPEDLAPGPAVVAAFGACF